MDSTRPVDAEQLKRWLAGVFERAAPTYGRVGPPYRAQLGQPPAELGDIPRPRYEAVVIPPTWSARNPKPSELKPALCRLDQ
jgi:hypothetical protein